MKPIVRDFSDFAGWPAALHFLAASPTHFITADELPPAASDEAIGRRVIAVDQNGRPSDYQAAETRASRLMAQFVACERMAWGRENELAAFLQDFAGQLKDKIELRAVARHIIGKVSSLFRSDGASILVMNEEKDGLRFAACHTQNPEVEDRLNNLRLPLGVGIAGWVAANRKPILVNDTQSDDRFHAGIDKTTHFKTTSLIAAPIILGEEMLGVLEVVNGDDRPFSGWDMSALSVVASVVAIFLQKAQLEQQRRKYLRAQGKAEVANSVLHNIGNVLNSVNVDCSQVRSILEGSRLDRFRRTLDLIEEQGTDLAGFLTEHPQGKRLPEFLAKIASALEDEQEKSLAKLATIAQRTHLMADIIETQQVIARKGHWETQDLVEAIEEALDVQGSKLQKLAIRVEKHFHTDRPVRGSKTKLIHLLVNIIKNGIEAMASRPEDERVLELETSETESGETRLRISDRGEGITAATLEKLFQHGFTTKVEGNGYGLAFSAQTMAEMGGKIHAASQGPGKGATFTLVFPIVGE